MDWAEGYHAELDYTSGYYHELGPAHLELVCLLAGVRFDPAEQPAYLELGFGQGVSINIHAAAGKGVFWGCDFNPGQTAHARDLARATQADLTLTDQSFAEFAARDDLPEFDVIALHGVWSWVSEANRKLIADLIRRRLKPGGLVYVSYNCMPGWAAGEPARRLLNLGRDYAGQRRLGAEAGLEAGLEFLEEVMAAEGRFFADNKLAAAHGRSLSKAARPYLAHEYFNSEFHAPYFTDVATALGEAKLTFVGSARLLDRINAYNLKPASVALLDRQKDPVLKEAVRDFLVDQRFRPDVWIKGAIPLTPIEQQERLDRQAFVLACTLEEIEFTVNGALGETTLPQMPYGSLAKALAEGDYRPKTAAELVEAVTGTRRTDLLTALTTMIGMGVVRPARGASRTAIRRCEGYNARVLERAVTGPHLMHLASPVVEGGVLTTRSAQLFLRAWRGGAKTAQALAEAIWDVLQTTRERAVKDGREVTSLEENLAVLTEMAGRFLNDTLQLYRALEIVGEDGLAKNDGG